MIPDGMIRELSEKLESIRGNGGGAILFDSRDAGNYSSHDLKKVWDLFDRHDPTSFAAALMLDEMIEATISLSKVSLARVLREDGFVKSLSDIVEIKSTLARHIEVPRDEFIDRLTESLSEFSDLLTRPSNREVAVCLRDAIHSIDRSLKLNWLQNTGDPSESLPLSPHILSFASMPDFLSALRSDTPFGAHVACIAGKDTVIGLKQPGRIAYLSSYSISIHTGKMEQQLTSDSHMAQGFDIGRPTERYPSWRSLSAKKAVGSGDGAPGALYSYTGNTVDHISSLPRDTILWLALVVEMTKRTMVLAEVDTLALADTMVNAIASSNSAQLPAVIANWSLKSEDPEELFKECEFDQWTENLLRPALKGLTPDHLLQVGEDGYYLLFDSLKVVSFDEFSRLKLVDKLDGVRCVSVSSTLVGTKEQIEEVRHRMMGRNLTNFVIQYGNNKISHAWIKTLYKWFMKQIDKDFEEVLLSKVARIRLPENVAGSIHFYADSPDHKGHHPRCIFNEKLDPTHQAVLIPQNSAEVVEMLGIKGESRLPEILRGWSRIKDDSSREVPFGVARKWAWNNLNEGCVNQQIDRMKIDRNSIRSDGFLSAYASFSRASFPEALDGKEVGKSGF